MPMMPAISSGARMQGLVMYLAGPGKANEHTNPHVVAASSREVFAAGGAGGQMAREQAYELGHALDEARVVFGTEVTRRDTAALKAAQTRGVTGKAAIAEATRDENVWHCSLSLPPDAAALDDATWSAIAHDFMQGMGFDDADAATARWVAIRHGLTKNGGDHIHIAASRVRDDGTVVPKWRPHPTRGGNEGDYARAQRVARDIEVKYGLEVLSSYNKDMASRGRAHAQDGATKPQLDAKGNVVREPRIAESPSVTLARRVRAAAAAAESEAEFVRMVRADGLVIRAARYDKTNPRVVTGFSVGLPASEYANKHGQPVMHGGKKLAEDLSLPRLREGWIDDANSRADALSAWDHADERAITPRELKPTQSRDAATPRDASSADVTNQLRAILTPLAQSAATEADYAKALRDHPDVLARPRYAKGSTTQVTGYAVALRPRLASDAEGKAIWRNASYLGDGLALKDLRQRWPDSDNHRALAAAAWSRTSRASSARADDNPTMRRLHDDARRWQRTVTSINDPHSRAWHTAAADTAGAVGAAARGLSGEKAQSLNQLADALGAVSGHRRPTQPQAVRSYTSARRVAATMLAAGRDDTTLLWLAAMKQVLAASKAISEAMAAQGHTRQARHVTAAITATDLQFHGEAYTPSRDTRSASGPTAVPTRPRTSTPTTGRGRERG
ncbi:relaxase/mobilization nuclease domain-containing protein (plasmid) [Gordonia amicalis]|uniref:relaxase/mobilization nuclease domain-containing protein n=1 Tax=Gordonia TaxID=2053 RepID=UPI0015F3935E|nr:MULTISPECIES: relaxase [Gordonia]MBA5846325.1 relaxase [Gordonia amicalis]MDH3026215.1 relaxase [Gordonia alkanivorans]UOG23667.1 relaxase/mobilization nuclease domain-containing protein [Gordonia amicalis]UPW16459.1 relaxase/mobilization nuclease domain-containing protein [Gordonia amicalis]